MWFGGHVKSSATALRGHGGIENTLYSELVEAR